MPFRSPPTFEPTSPTDLGFPIPWPAGISKLLPPGGLPVDDVDDDGDDEVEEVIPTTDDGSGT